jgi:hypothetical protein
VKVQAPVSDLRALRLALIDKVIQKAERYFCQRRFHMSRAFVRLDVGGEKPLGIAKFFMQIQKNDNKDVQDDLMFIDAM